MNQIFKLLDQESFLQKNTINLIASENYPSSKVLELQGSIFNNKYGEGYPFKRYYAGNANTDVLESEVKELALEVFNAAENYDVNIQCLSGSPANSMVYLAMLEYNDTIMSMNLSNGGHLSHLHTTSNWNKFFKHVTYDINKDLSINIQDYTDKIITHRPKLVIIGFSSYPLSFEFKDMIRIAHDNGALVLCDIAHISGLIASGNHPSPFIGDSIEQADFVTTTTHKTFRGPRGALIFSKKDLVDYYQSSTPFSKLIDKTVFPGTSGGPHFSTIAGIGQACLEILGKDQYDDKITYKDYIKQVKLNITALEKGLMFDNLNEAKTDTNKETLNLNKNLILITPSSNHLTLIKLPDELDSLIIQKKLESYGIITNRNLIPFDNKTAWKPSGLRLGSPAMTSRGANEKDMFTIGIYINQIINNTLDEDAFTEFKSELFLRLNNPAYLK